MNKPREFWIEKFNGRVPPSFYAFLDKPNFNKLKLKLNETELIDASEYYHVIEYAAYEKLQQENERHKELNIKLANNNADYNAENLKLKQVCEIMREALEMLQNDGHSWIDRNFAKVELEKVKELK